MLDSFDDGAFNDGWVDILGVKIGTLPAAQDFRTNSPECPPNTDPSCQPILASITAQVPLNKNVNQQNIATQILREIRQSLASGLSSTSIPEMVFLPTITDTVQRDSLGDGPGFSKLATHDNTNLSITALGATLLGLFVTVIIAALVLLLMKFREYNQGDNKLTSPTTIQHYPITGDSSDSSDCNMHTPVSCEIWTNPVDDSMGTEVYYRNSGH